MGVSLNSIVATNKGITTIGELAQQTDPLIYHGSRLYRVQQVNLYTSDKVHFTQLEQGHYLFTDHIYQSEKVWLSNPSNINRVFNQHTTDYSLGWVVGKLHYSHIHSPEFIFIKKQTKHLDPLVQHLEQINHLENIQINQYQNYYKIATPKLTHLYTSFINPISLLRKDSYDFTYGFLQSCFDHNCKFINESDLADYHKGIIILAPPSPVVSYILQAFLQVLGIHSRIGIKNAKGEVASLILSDREDILKFYLLFPQTDLQYRLKLQKYIDSPDDTPPPDYYHKALIKQELVPGNHQLADILINSLDSFNANSFILPNLYAQPGLNL